MADTEQRQEPDAEGNKVVDVLLGPYRGQRLKMPAGEADQAIADNWARDPFGPLPVPQPKEGEEPAPLLSDEERKAAHDASVAWAVAQWDASQQLETTDMKQVREARERRGEPSTPTPDQPQQRPREAAMAPATPAPNAPEVYETRRGPGRPPGSTRRE